MQAYEAAYQYFRDALFVPLGEDLPDPILTFSRGTKKKRAFFVAQSWHTQDDAERRCELAIVPAHTADPPREVMASLVHEMAHYADFLAGTAPKSSGYHGKKWAERMEKIGLPALRESKTSHISVSHEITEGGPYDLAFNKLPKEILLPFVAENNVTTEPNSQETEQKKETKKGKRFKYACPKCATTMRGPTGRKLICGDCEVPYAEDQSTSGEHEST